MSRKLDGVYDVERAMKQICVWCQHPMGAIHVTLSTDRGREEVCATCGRAELERRAREEKGVGEDE